MKPSLLILAAGVGSRYGGLKQVDGVGPGGAAILEYSVFDAIRAGFGKVVCVIRRDIEADFRRLVSSKFEKRIPTVYAFQEKDTALEWLSDIPERSKPWGTGHAILSARHLLTEPFATINADDFYGLDTFRLMADFLSARCTPRRYGMVAYLLGNTLSDNGAVSRGVCEVGEQNTLVGITEQTHIERDSQGRIRVGKPEENGPILADDMPVSMNIFGLHQEILPELDRQFREFVQAHQDQPKAEFYIPKAVDKMIRDGSVAVEVMRSESKWLGVTYPEDKQTVSEALGQMVGEGVYPASLWA
ncbi:MAG: NDP-sugar synthase [Saprospiraceae bacterium]